jgi:hypothetical protein
MTPDKPSRKFPSRRYQSLLEQYREMHREGEKHLGIPPEQTFDGRSLPPQAAHIKRLVQATGARSLLDYGSGKGRQYQPLRVVDREAGVDYPDMKSYWGVDEIRCYDPGYAPFSELPSGTFDGVICTDVLEHCPEEDVAWILEEMFGFARKFVFATVACFPARKRLPTGENAHCTIKPAPWWQACIAAAAGARPGLTYEFRLAYPSGDRMLEAVVTPSARA